MIVLRNLSGQGLSGITCRVTAVAEEDGKSESVICVGATECTWDHVPNGGEAAHEVSHPFGAPQMLLPHGHLGKLPLIGDSQPCDEVPDGCLNHVESNFASFQVDFCFLAEGRYAVSAVSVLSSDRGMMARAPPVYVSV